MFIFSIYHFIFSPGKKLSISSKFVIRRRSIDILNKSCRNYMYDRMIMFHMKFDAAIIFICSSNNYYILSNIYIIYFFYAKLVQNLNPIHLRPIIIVLLYFVPFICIIVLHSFFFCFICFFFPPPLINFRKLITCIFFGIKIIVYRSCL
jgi:hypothetical protein